jgi:hypothetical protein
VNFNYSMNMIRHYDNFSFYSRLMKGEAT